MKIAITVPCYIEEENISPFNPLLKHIVNKYKEETVLVNDGRRGDSLEMIKQIQGKLSANNI